MHEVPLQEFELLSQGLKGGWMAELNSYLGEVLVGIKADIDVIQYWHLGNSCFHFYHTNWYQIESSTPLPDSQPDLMYSPAICAMQMTFSSSKQVATDWQAHLGDKIFEEILLMKFVWKSSVIDLAAWNSECIKEVELESQQYKDLLNTEVLLQEFD